MGRVRTIGFGENKSALIFQHIAKCAGSTIERLLSKVFEHSFQVRNSWDYEKVLDSLEDPHVKIDALAIYGGGVAGIHHILPDDVDCYYVTILRDPFRRAVSHVRFDRALGLSGEGDFEKALLDTPNVMTEALAAGYLELALERMRQEFFFVGFVESMDKSVTRLCRLMGLAEDRIRDVYKAVNVSKKKNEILQPDKRFLRVHADDYTLYQAAFSRFSEEIVGVEHVVESKGTEYSGSLFSETRQKQSSQDTVDRLKEKLDRDDGIAVEDKLTALILALAEFDQAEGLKYYRRLVAQNPAFVTDSLGLELPDGMACELLDAAMARLPVLIIPPGDAGYNRNRQMMVLRLAELALAKKDVEEAESQYARAYGLNPDNWEAARAYASILRVVGKPEKGIEILKALPASFQRSVSFKLEILVSAYQAGGLECVAELIGKMFDDGFIATVFEDVGFPEKEAHLFENLPDVTSVLIFKSAPDMVCDDLMNQVTARWPDAQVDIVVQPGAGVLEKWKFNQVFPLPPGLFSLEGAREAMRGKPDNVRYDLAIIPINGQMPLDRYTHFFEFVAELEIPLVGSYTLWNCFTTTGKGIVFRNGKEGIRA